MKLDLSGVGLQSLNFWGWHEYPHPHFNHPAELPDRENNGYFRCGWGKCYGNNNSCGCGSFQAQPGNSWWCTCGHRYEDHGS